MNMGIVLQIFLFSLFISGVIYFLLIAAYTYGWFQLHEGFEPEKKLSAKVSVIVAARNEENNILNLLNSLKQQVYPKKYFEIIIVDDSSTDNTKNAVAGFIRENRDFKISLLDSEGEGKKQAVYTGIKYASYKLIATTDADCVVGNMWLWKLVAYFEKYSPALIMAPVVYDKEKGFLQKLFSLEFASLVASQAGACGIKMPFMGNTANMAFSKEVYNRNIINNYSSGDDVFLIHHVKKEYGNNSIHFLKDKAVTVKTVIPGNLKEFLDQRIRWGSKAKGYRDVVSVFSAMTVFLFNAGLFLMFLLMFFFPWMLPVWFLYVIMKTLVDFPLLRGYLLLTDKTYLIKYISVAEMLYPLYISLTGILSLSKKYEWKGRKGLK